MSEKCQQGQGIESRRRSAPLEEGVCPSSSCTWGGFLSFLAPPQESVPLVFSCRYRPTGSPLQGNLQSDELLTDTSVPS